MPEIQLPTAAKQDSIYTNIGVPTSVASSATNASAHAKLNALLQDTTQIKSNNVESGTLSSSWVTNGSHKENVALEITGRGVLHNIFCATDMITVSVQIDGGKIHDVSIPTTSIRTLTLNWPFKQSLKVTYKSTMINVFYTLL